MFCGDTLPLQYMSAYNWMRVRFVSNPSPDKGQASGFEFQYKFRKGTVYVYTLIDHFIFSLYNIPNQAYISVKQ